MQKIIHLKDMSYSIPYGELILDKINLELEAGTFLGVLGHNGAGKTTLMDILMGFRKASSGEALIFGEDPHAITRSHRKDVAFLSQDVNLKGAITIRNFLDFHGGFHDNYNKDLEEHLLKVFELQEDSKIGALSLGQQKKVQVVSGIACLPKLILIDEITAVLDPETRVMFFREIESYRRNFPCAVILATNIAEDLVERVDSILFIKNKCGKLHSPLEIIRLFNLQQGVA